MIRFNLAYRHGNNEVEGFSAFAFTKEDAKAAAEAKAREKASFTPYPFSAARMLYSFDGLNAAEKRCLKADWKSYDDEGPGRSGLARLSARF